MIGFDAYFLNNPTKCFFSSSCASFTGYYSYDYYGLSNTNTLYSIKVPLIQGQLAAGVLMLVSCMIYMVIFAVTAYRVSRSAQLSTVPKAPTGYVPQPVHPGHGHGHGHIPVGNIVQPPPANPAINPPRNELICPNCRSRFSVAHQRH